MNTTCITYADILRPSGRISSIAYDTMLVLAGSILIALSAKIAFPLPFSPVPVTGQTFAVLLTGALLGSKRGVLAVLAYIAEGISGMPVFTGAGAGFAYLLGPTGGYIAGFAAAAGITGLLAEKGWDRNIFTTAMAMAAGSAAIYLFGVMWLSLFVGGRALNMGLIPFISGDIVKVALAAALLPAGWKLITR
ncbi:MAG TPA: biotin transporter BioY [Spirochaetota bacterium]|nr:biotin transporter BioY [Spirochaetota bacterium]